MGKQISRNFSTADLLHLPSDFCLYSIFWNGVVMQGVLSDGTELAVKLLNNSNQVLVEFLNEIVTITNVRHKNLVKLKGCCVKGDQRLLVYEYVENKNLAEALWGMYQHPCVAPSDSVT